MLRFGDAENDGDGFNIVVEILKMKKLSLLVTLYLFAFSVYAQSWDSLDTGIDGGLNYGRVFSLSVYNSELYVAGSFSYAGGNPVQSIASWNGSNWFALGAPSITAIRTTTVYNNKLYVGDPLVGAYGVSTWDGSNWQTSGSLPQAAVALGVYNNSIYASVFVNANDDYIYKLEDGSWDLINAGIDNAVNAFAVYNNELYAGGNFLTAGGDSVRRIARWNDASWSAAGEGLNQVVWCLTIHNGELYAGGNFSSRVSKWDGTTWTDIGFGFDSDVRALCSFNGVLYAGGNFTTAGGIPANHIAQWDGTSWSALGDGVDSTVFALCVYNSAIYAGGLFSYAGGIPANRIAKWNPLGIGILESVNENEVDVFPNPATTQLTISGYTPAYLKLCNTLGQTVAEASNTTTLLLGTLPQGLYVLQLFDAKGGLVRAEKVVKE